MRFKLKFKLNSSKHKTNANKMKTTIPRRNWTTNNWSKHTQVTMAMLLLLHLTMGIGECQQHAGHLSISQISPKSSSHLDADIDTYLSASSALTLESTIENEQATQPQSEQNLFSAEDNETRRYNRVERSAQPILNDQFPKTGPNDLHSPNDGDIKEAAAGRYFQYNIKPTGTYENLSDTPQLTKRDRSGKTLQSAKSSSPSLSSSSFLLKGDLRPITSRSPIIPTSSIASSMVASATAMPHKPRQNPNPDIQDIITGIVKLLNGNVNVHANTQGIRRPTASRINNRGPPRISDVPPLPMDYDNKKASHGTSIRPPPYPFDRPERPFITGVPIPEQIVPYRPGFVSNRPPWHRNKPRPPITTSIGSRRPIHQYKPLPPNEVQTASTNEQPQIPPQESKPSHLPTTQNAPLDTEPTSGDDLRDNQDTPFPTDSSYDSEFSSEDSNAQYIEVSGSDSETAATGTNADELDEELQPPPPTSPLNSMEYNPTKKKPNKHKNTNDKKKPNSNDYTTIVETSSEVNTVINTPSSYLPMPMASAEDIYIGPSTEEVIFMTTNKTPALEHTSTKPSPDKPSYTSASKSITTSPIKELDFNTADESNLPNRFETSILPSPSTDAPSIPSTTITSTITSIATTNTDSNSSIHANSTSNNKANGTTTDIRSQQYHPRPGIVLDDPEFKPGGRPRPQRPQQAPTVQIQPTRHHLPPGYGEIFDVTLSAIQGPGTLGGSQQTIKIKPYGSYGSGGTGQQEDIIVSASGEDRFVSIDGKRTYINLFGDPTDAPTDVQSVTTTTAIPQQPSSVANNAGIHSKNSLPSVGAGYGVSETEVVELGPTKPQGVKPKGQVPLLTTKPGSTRPHYRQRPTQPPVRIDTCIVGDDSTCDQAQHEHCKTESGVSSCHCRPGYSRRKHREPCRKVISFHLGMRVDRIYEHRIVWDSKLMDRNSEPYGQLSYESIRAIDSAMSMTPYSDEFMDARVNNIYRGDPKLGGSGVFVNMTIKLDESVETLRPNLRSDVQKHLLGVLHRRNNNIGNSVLYVSTPEGAVSALHDLDECQSRDLNDCHPSATCTNSWGSFRCACDPGFRDPWADQPQRAGRDCQTCADTYCNNHGICSFSEEGIQVCTCDSTHYGGQCEIDGEVLGVAIGASVAAVIIIVLTLICLIMWSRRWQREQKNALGSPVFGYMNTAPLKSAGLGQPGYQVTLEDRMRWAQIADVMAQTNHYGAEPIGPTRPSSALFAAYPSLQAAALGMGTLGAMSMQSTLQMHQNASMAPPVPLPRRLGLSTRSNGMRTLENSSSSEEEDRTDLLGRNFQVPRPKSRSNGSIANQSGIYYDVDYEPSGNGIGNTSVDHLYGSQNQSSSHSHTHSHAHSGNSHGIPMSTYMSGRNSYFMK